MYSKVCQEHKHIWNEEHLSEHNLKMNLRELIKKNIEPNSRKIRSLIRMTNKN